MEILRVDLSCAIESIRDGEMPAKSCVLFLLSKFLGYSIIVMSVTVKLPQVRTSFCPIQFEPLTQ